MVFTSFIFLFLFLPLFLAGYFGAPARFRNAILLVASYVFYGYWRADFTLLLLFSTVIDYACGWGIHRSAKPLPRRILLLLSVTANLGLLGYFKYYNFGMENLSVISQMLGGSWITWEWVILPVGISFFTFQSMSYTIDIYRGSTAPARNILDFATYVALFPQLVAGPIVRYRTIAEELHSRQVNWQLFSTGVQLFCIGINKKVLLANNLGVLADGAFNLTVPHAADAWVGLIAYTFQLYYDFSGYSDMAIGLGAMLGFHFPENFNSPYKADSITAFWRRWHISLSTWLRDYLYVSLGGNRHSTRRTYINLFITMLLGGLWHGAQWTFVLWGAYHGMLLALERANGKRPKFYGAAPLPVRIFCTFLLVMFGWLLFRATSVNHVLLFVVVAVDPSTWFEGFAMSVSGLNFQLGVLAVAAAIAFFAPNARHWAGSDRSWKRYFQLALFVVAIHELMTQGFNPFLYFNF